MYYAAPYLIAIGRVLMAVMFIQAGINKIFGYAGAQGIHGGGRRSRRCCCRS